MADTDREHQSDEHQQHALHATGMLCTPNLPYEPAQARGAFRKLGEPVTDEALVNLLGVYFNRMQACINVLLNQADDSRLNPDSDWHFNRLMYDLTREAESIVERWRKDAGKEVVRL